MTVVLMPRMQTSRAYEFMGVNPPSFPSIPPHENAALNGYDTTNRQNLCQQCFICSVFQSVIKLFIHTTVQNIIWRRGENVR